MAREKIEEVAAAARQELREAREEERRAEQRAYAERRLEREAQAAARIEEARPHPRRARDEVAAQVVLLLYDGIQYAYHMIPICV